MKLRVGRTLALLFFLSSALTWQFTYAQTRLAIPTYAAPGSSKWNSWQQLGPQSLGIMILNLNNGDETRLDTSAASAVNKARDAGITVLSYVHTGYGKRDPAEVRSKIDAAFKNYSIDGIFFDETPTDCSSANRFAGTNVRYYEELANYVHAMKAGRRITVLNPGVTPPEDCWMKFTDILLTFEEPTLANYQQKYVEYAWTHQYAPERFWHLIYSVNSQSDMRAIVELARKRGVGWLYVTDDGPDGNPWDDVPSYLAEEAVAWTGHAVEASTTKAVAIPAGESTRRVSIRWRAPKGVKSQILLDVDQKSSTGFRDGGISIGADFVIEVTDGAANVMRYAGSGADWKWTTVDAHAKLISPEPGVNVVEFDAYPLGAATVVKVQFRSLDNSWNPVFTSGVVKWSVGAGK